jgi:outer membrane protein TolC
MMLVMATGVSVLAGSQAPVVLDVRRSVEIALENNLSIMIARKEAAKTGHRIAGATSAAFPYVSLDGSYSHISKLPVLSGNVIGVEDTHNAWVSFNQTLYSGGKVSGGIKIAQLLKESAEEDIRLAKHEIVFQTKKVFHDVLVAERLVLVNNDSLGFLRTQMAETEVRYERGMVPELDVLALKVRVADAETEVTKAQNALKIARESFNKLLNFDLDSEVVFEGELKFEPILVSTEEAVAAGEKGRPEMKKAALQLEMVKESIRVAMADSKASVNLNARYILDSTPGAFNIGGEEDTWNAQVVCSMPVFDGFKTRSNVAEARENVEQVQLQVEQLKKEINLEVRTSINNLNEGEKVIHTQGMNVQRSEEALKAARERYAVGKASYLEFLESELELTRARTNYTRSLYGYIVVGAALDKAVGKD